jgi:hypothetical protein
MDGLKIVPQLFFDAIARAVPGATALLLLFAIVGTDWWRSGLSGVLGGQRSEQYPVTFVTITLLFLSYLLGHVMSPFTKVVQRVGEKLWWFKREDGARWFEKDGTGKRRLLPFTRVRFRKANSMDYDWLRMHRPDVGALCAKLRGEFTMYNSLAVVFLSCGALTVSTRAGPLSSYSVFFLLALLMAYRGRETAETFATTVDHFRKAARDDSVLATGGRSDSPGGAAA